MNLVYQYLYCSRWQYIHDLSICRRELNIDELLMFNTKDYHLGNKHYSIVVTFLENVELKKIYTTVQNHYEKLYLYFGYQIYSFEDIVIVHIRTDMYNRVVIEAYAKEVLIQKGDGV